MPEDIESENRQLRQVIHELGKSSQELRCVNQELRLANQTLLERIQKLERQLKTNSRNSSKPPNSDQKAKPPMGKLKGGVPKGHKGYFRAVFSPESVTERIQVMPESCPRCGSHELVSERKPQFHREVDLPQSAIIRDYRLERCRCQGCGKHLKADLPPGVSKTAMGSRLSALIGQWSQRFNFPIRKIADLIQQLTGHRFCSATILACQTRCSEAVASTHQEIAEQSQQELWRGADETPWSSHGNRRYVWIASGNETTHIRIQERRNIATA